jgi:hypothetical protein
VDLFIIIDHPPPLVLFSSRLRARECYFFLFDFQSKGTEAPWVKLELISWCHFLSPKVSCCFVVNVITMETSGASGGWCFWCVEMQKCWCVVDVFSDTTGNTPTHEISTYSSTNHQHNTSTHHHDITTQQHVYTTHQHINTIIFMPSGLHWILRSERGIVGSFNVLPTRFWCKLRWISVEFWWCSLFLWVTFRCLSCCTWSWPLHPSHWCCVITVCKDWSCRTSAWPLPHTPMHSCCATYSVSVLASTDYSYDWNRVCVETLRSPNNSTGSWSARLPV